MNTPVGTTKESIFHLHPLLRCNLSCVHCYSSSSPRADAMLSKEESLSAIRQASAWGYSTLSISGGEPLLYPWLRDIVSEADSLGMHVSLVTNGLLVDRPGNLDILRTIDTLAISIDGLDDNHDWMRGRTRTLTQVRHSLSALAGHGIPYAINCSITAKNIDELEDLIEMAWESGAAGIQFHPIELAGRAANAHSLALTQHEANIFFVASRLLAVEYAGRLPVQADVVHRDWVLECPASVYAHPLEQDTEQIAPAELLGVLVLEPNGRLCPISYGFASAYQLGNIRKHPMARLWPAYLSGAYERLRRLGRSVYEAIRKSQDTIFNPNELLARTALEESFINWRKP